jgi:predicted Fe-Mo cluster-binding NifX family protein
MTSLARQMLKGLVMRIAIPQWQGRIAPVFDVAGHLLLIDVEDSRETRREEKQLLKTELWARVAELLGYGADVLICGAISAPLQFRIAASGVRVIAFVCGAVDEVLAAYLRGALVDPRFAMPGCRRWRRGDGEDVLPVEFATPHRRGRLGRGWGISAGSVAGKGPQSALAVEFFVCPGCGEKIPRRRNQAQNVCPRCGASAGPF